jgi:hypothetical protein
LQSIDEGVELRGRRATRQGSMAPWERGAVHMARVAHRCGGGASAGSGCRREGERDPQPMGQLGRLAAQWVGLKATGLKGQIGRQGGWADWTGTFRNQNWIFEFSRAL